MNQLGPNDFSQLKINVPTDNNLLTSEHIASYIFKTLHNKQYVNFVT